MFSYDSGMLDLAKLRAVPVTVPPRGAGKIWQGVQHGTLVDSVMDHGRDTYGMVYDRSDTRVWTTADGGDMACSIAVAGSRCDEFIRRGLTPHLGLLASNRQTEVLTAFCGAVHSSGLQMVCAKLSRNKDAKWMYTTHFDLNYVRDTVCKWWLRHLPGVLADHDRLEQFPAKPGRVANVLVAVGRKEILPWSRVGQADHVFRQGRGTTFLDLYRALSMPMPLSNPVAQLKNGWRLNSLLTHCASKKSKETV